MPLIRRFTRLLPGYQAGRRAVLNDLQFLVDTAPTGEAQKVLTAAREWILAAR